MIELRPLETIFRHREQRQASGEPGSTILCKLPVPGKNFSAFSGEIPCSECRELSL
jgi:hypothetical protein